jgi:hypothetical protein
MAILVAMNDAATPTVETSEEHIHTLQESRNLADEARSVLEMNDRGTHTVPAGELYPHQWLWDSCFIAIGMRHYDVERAKIELLSLMRGQWSNGMLPHIIFNNGSGYKPDQNAWRSWVNPHSADDVKTSGITQPPMLAEAIVQVGASMSLPERRSWYKMMWPGLLAYHEWLYRERDPHAEGLVLQIHPWETGLDNTPPWMGELHEHLMPAWIRFLRFSRMDKALNLVRRDTRFVPAEQRFTNVDILALFSVQRRLRRKGYDIHKILDHSLFAIEDLTYNCILIRANEHLRSIAKSIREQIPHQLDIQMGKSPKKLEELWDQYAQSYFSRDFITHKLLKEQSIASLMPLYAGTISKERADLLVRSLESDHLFGPAFPVPSVPLSSDWHDSNRYWQGPSWVNTNWLIIDGLERYGYKKHAEALRESTLEMVEQGGFYEYFNPLTGAPLGSQNFSWTAALTIDLLHKK